ncbi:MAG: Uma2 family endonuclease [Vulcanimicrobiota bacterium]
MVLNPCSWETYHRILEEHQDRTSPRFTYDEGRLEIMRPSPEHEELNEAVKQIVSLACEELEIEVRPLGSTTQRSLEQHKGVEPDSSFYFGQTDRDPHVAPPDLVVEVEISRSALDKLPIFAALAVPEVWRCGRDSVEFLRLSETGYEAVDRSVWLPVTSVWLARQLVARPKMPRSQWLKAMRASLAGC